MSRIGPETIQAFLDTGVALGELTDQLAPAGCELSSPFTVGGVSRCFWASFARSSSV
ncbi:MAG: hypothetical protein ABI182_02785 [Candidatus Baltobacteraceae bacterium]